MQSKHHTGRYLLASSIVLALLVSPFALAAGEGNPIRGGARNPSSNESQALTRETEIIASTDTYGTRQSNKGAGGGAIYGCRSATGAEPCIRSNNLEKGRAFELVTGGAEAGRIEAVGGDNAKPFTTNATGVADGLNADRVDGKNAADIVADAQNLTKFAAVAADGKLESGRGAASASRTSAGNYAVTFVDDISKCAYSATQVRFDENNGAIAVELAAGGKTLNVRTRNGGGADGTGPTNIADKPFHLVVNC
jgi:hypothetical protein